MIKFSRLILVLMLFTYYSRAQSNTLIKVYKNKEYEIQGTNEHITLYKKVNTDKYYFSSPLGNKIIRLTYFRINHKNASTYKIRENCRELRRRKIKLYQKYKDGEYYAFKVFNSYIQ